MFMLPPPMPIGIPIPFMSWEGLIAPGPPPNLLGPPFMEAPAWKEANRAGFMDWDWGWEE